MNEADTCRKYVVPKLTEAGWDDDPHSIAEQRTFTDGRIIVAGAKMRAPRDLDHSFHAIVITHSTAS
jgi:type I site-specific restriction endonuclease